MGQAPPRTTLTRIKTAGKMTRKPNQFVGVTGPVVKRFAAMTPTIAAGHATSNLVIPCLTGQPSDLIRDTAQSLYSGGTRKPAANRRRINAGTDPKLAVPSDLLSSMLASTCVGMTDLRVTHQRSWSGDPRVLQTNAEDDRRFTIARSPPIDLRVHLRTASHRHHLLGLRGAAKGFLARFGLVATLVRNRGL